MNSSRPLRWRCRYSPVVRRELAHVARVAQVERDRLAHDGADAVLGRPAGEQEDRGQREHDQQHDRGDPRLGRQAGELLAERGAMGFGDEQAGDSRWALSCRC